MIISQVPEGLAVFAELAVGRSFKIFTGKGYAGEQCRVDRQTRHRQGAAMKEKIL